ncbi:MAG: hypothetical protein FD152_580 [Xanthobacteraceae bacterium]|nr:MAG: hypothetical protein FD152_580 [Xanthobacteraceae bacterium]
MNRVISCLAAAVLASSLCGLAAPAFAQSAAVAPVALPQSMPARVYLIRGLFEVFSLGMDRLGSHLRRDGHAARVYGAASADALTAEIIARRRAVPGETVVLIGHSLGADAAIRIANRVQAAGAEPVSLIVTFDPTSRQELRGGAKRVVNLFQSNNGWAVPVNRGQAFAGRFENRDLRDMAGINHLNIEKSGALHRQVQAWVAEAVAADRPVSQPARARPRR